MKKRLNYYTATVEEIAEHFDKVSRANISKVRQNHKHEKDISQKLDDALALMYKNRLKAKLQTM